MVGVLICLVNAPKVNKSYTNAEFLALFRAPSFITFIVLLLVFIVVLWYAKQRILDEVDGDWGRLREREFLKVGVGVGGWGGGGDVVYTLVLCP